MEGYKSSPVIIDEIKGFFNDLNDAVKELPPIVSDERAKEKARQAYLHRKAVEKRKKRKRGGPK